MSGKKKKPGRGAEREREYFLVVDGDPEGSFISTRSELEERTLAFVGDSDPCQVQVYELVCVGEMPDPEMVFIWEEH